MINSPNPQLVLTPAGSIGIGGDSNSPMVWSEGVLKQYSSHYPHNGSFGGVTSYGIRFPNVETAIGGVDVTGDRSFLGSFDPPAYGPWFEAVIADSGGNLYVYYHTETLVYSGTKIHPAIGSQKSTDGGKTWTDFGGLIIDTPSGTDIGQGEPTNLGYGFIGGNGDCSAMLDETSTYIYFFFSQYGRTSGVQGICSARMLWANRDNPVGNVFKYYSGSWTQSGVGGQASQLIANIGDIHGQFATQDYWWGPSVSWNTYLKKYVLMLNRSNNSNFNYTNDNTNWFSTSSSLESPDYHFPERVPYTNGYLGDWYPMSVGLESGLGSDKYGGRTVRIFCAGSSNWYGTYYNSLENPNPPSVAAGSIRGRGSR